jgi:hypothetical protein
MMLHIFINKTPWFRARRFGYGAGLPFTWQGWMLIGCYVATLAGIGTLSKAPDTASRGLAFALFLVVTGIFLAVLRKHTEGGWRWRWGTVS